MIAGLWTEVEEAMSVGFRLSNAQALSMQRRAALLLIYLLVLTGIAAVATPSRAADEVKTVRLYTLADVTYVVFSHFHSDHTGNANLFGAATWIIRRSVSIHPRSAPTRLRRRG